MDFLGRVEASLRRTATGNSRMLEWGFPLVHAALEIPFPETPTPNNESKLDEKGRRWIYRKFRDCATLLVLERHGDTISVDSGWEWKDETAHVMDRRDARPVDMLMHHWYLLLLKKLGVNVEEAWLSGLWERAFEKQSPAGHLHPLTPDTLLDAFVYDEFTALHAAYRSALRLRDPQKLAQCRRIVEYHVANTQPDHTTAEPWALAAFAALDNTHTFAEQQLHDATTAATAHENPVILALLADAVLTLREAAQTSAQ